MQGSSNGDFLPGVMLKHCMDYIKRRSCYRTFFLASLFYFLFINSFFFKYLFYALSPGSAVLVLSGTEVDSSNQSYYGEQHVGPLLL